MYIAFKKEMDFVLKRGTKKAFPFIGGIDCGLFQLHVSTANLCDDSLSLMSICISECLPDLNNHEIGKIQTN